MSMNLNRVGGTSGRALRNDLNVSIGFDKAYASDNAIALRGLLPIGSKS